MFWEVAENKLANIEVTLNQYLVCPPRASMNVASHWTNDIRMEVLWDVIPHSDEVSTKLMQVCWLLRQGNLLKHIMKILQLLCSVKLMVTGCVVTLLLLCLTPAQFCTN